MPSSILSNLGKIQGLENRANYQSWKSRLEGILELEGLRNIVIATSNKGTSRKMIQWVYSNTLKRSSSRIRPSKYHGYTVNSLKLNPKRTDPPNTSSSELKEYAKPC